VQLCADNDTMRARGTSLSDSTQNRYKMLMYRSLEAKWLRFYPREAPPAYSCGDVM